MQTQRVSATTIHKFSLRRNTAAQEISRVGWQQIIMLLFAVACLERVERVTKRKENTHGQQSVHTTNSSRNSRKQFVTRGKVTVDINKPFDTGQAKPRQ